MDSEIARIYGNQVRIRVCGMCWQADRLLVVNHKGLTKRDFWAPAGGAPEFGEGLTQALQREFREETNLTITVGRFLFGCEFIQAPLHSVELFFDVTGFSGELKKGNDPEVAIIQDVAFMPLAEIFRKQAEEVHGIFHLARTEDALRSLQGFYRI